MNRFFGVIVLACLSSCSTVPQGGPLKGTAEGRAAAFREAVAEYAEVTDTKKKIAELMLTAFRNVPAYQVEPGSKNEKAIIAALEESFPELLDLYAETWSTAITLEEMQEVVALMKSEPGRTLQRFQDNALSTSGPLMAKYGPLLAKHLEGKL